MNQKLVAKIELPFRLPSWNNLLSIHRWRRKKLRDLMDLCASSLSPDYADSATPTVLRPSTSSTPLWMREYLKAMGQKSFAKSATGKRKPKKTPPR